MKTGIPNCVALLRWESENPFTLKQLCKLETKEQCNSLAFHPQEQVIAAGFENRCQLFAIDAAYTLREGDSIVTDFAKSDPRQKVVRFSPKGTELLTGGADGNIRIWQYPSLQKKFSLEGKGKEVTDADFNVSADKIVATYAGEAACTVWDGKSCSSRQVQHENNKFVMKGCRFAPDAMFVAEMKPGWGCRVTKWSNRTYKLLSVLKCSSIVHSSIMLSENYEKIGLGFVNGSVVVLNSINLTKVVEYKPHSFIVTGLAFTPNNSQLISASIDANCTIQNLDSIPSGKKLFSTKILLFLSIFMLVFAVLLQVWVL